MFRYFICWILLLCSSWFFQIRGLGKGDRVLDIFSISLIIFLIALYVVYEGRTRIKANFNIHIAILLLASLGSAIMADMYHNQSLSITIFQQRPIYCYLFYFLLHFLSPEPVKLEKMLIQFGVVFCLFFLLQTAVYPTLITEGHVFKDRGTLRIFIPGENIMLLAYLIAFDKIFGKFNWLYLIHIVLSLLVILLLGTRVMLLSIAILSFVNILVNKRVKNKFAIVLLFGVVVFISYWSMRETINEMVTETEKHTSQGDNYIRVKAAEYYLTDLTKNAACSVLGNGSPNEKSDYGMTVKSVNDHLGFYLSDIGILGIYVKYGLFFTAVCLVLMFQGIFSKLHRDLHYIKYFMVYLLINMVVSTLPFETGYGILEICIILYIIDYYKHQSLQNNDEDVNGSYEEPLALETPKYNLN